MRLGRRHPAFRHKEAGRAARRTDRGRIRSALAGACRAPLAPAGDCRFGSLARQSHCGLATAAIPCFRCSHGSVRFCGLADLNRSAARRSTASCSGCTDRDRPCRPIPGSPHSRHAPTDAAERDRATPSGHNPDHRVANPRAYRVRPGSRNPQPRRAGPDRRAAHQSPYAVQRPACAVRSAPAAASVPIVYVCEAGSFLPPQARYQSRRRVRRVHAIVHAATIRGRLTSGKVLVLACSQGGRPPRRRGGSGNGLARLLRLPLRPRTHVVLAGHLAAYLGLLLRRAELRHTRQRVPGVRPIRNRIAAGALAALALALARKCEVPRWQLLPLLAAQLSHSYPHPPTVPTNRRHTRLILTVPLRVSELAALVLPDP